MLHTKFQCHQPSGYGEGDFEKCFTVYERSGHHSQLWFLSNEAKLMALLAMGLADVIGIHSE